MKFRPILIVFALFVLASCERDIASRTALFLPELKFGTPKAQLISSLAQRFEYRADEGRFVGKDIPYEISVAFDRDSSLNSFTYNYYHDNGINNSRRSLFDSESNRLIESQGTPDDWMRRDSLGRQRMVWYYPKDSSVLSIELRRTGTVELESSRSGQRFRDVKYEMTNFLSAQD